MTNPTLPRRGIILLLVLGMLALFSLLTATYVIFSSQSRLASYAISQRNTRALDPAALLDQATLGALVGSNNPSSALWGNDLLADKYGFDSLIGNLRNANAFVIVGGETAGLPEYVVDRRFLRIQTNLGANVDLDDMLVGRLFTMTEGPLKDITFRIVRSFGDRSGLTGAELLLDSILVLDVGPYLDERISHEGRTQSLDWWLDPTNNATASLFYNKGVDGIWGDGPDAFTNAAELGTDDIGLPFVINGKERNGFGFGWNVGAGGQRNLNETVAINGEPVAVNLLPNYSTYRTTAAGLPAGDPDEPFDVPDYRDMFLAHFPHDPPPGNLVLGPNAPSFLRPALVNYIVSYYGTAFDSLSTVQLQNVLSMLIRSTMRPLPILNAPEYGGGARYAAFNGGGEGDIAFSTPINYTNPDANAVHQLAIALALGPWDVDNDGDGINDSVFVDVGMPLVTMPDGTLVQPMAAYRIEDLSGRVDLNATGSLATMRVPPIAYSTINTAVAVQSVYARGAVGAALTNPGTQSLIQGGGFGYGPADIDPRGIWGLGSGIGAASAPWANLIRERYGDVNNGIPGTGDGVAALSNEAIGILRRPNLPTIHGYGAWRGIPMDAWGRARIGVDPTGAPLVSTVGNFTYLTTDAIPDGNELVNDPYEAAFAKGGTGDQEYSLAEFEPVLRAWDWDRSQLPQRLVQQLEPIVTAGLNRQRLYRSVTAVSSSDDLLPAQPSRESSNLAVYAGPTDPMRRLLAGITPPVTLQKIQDFIPPEIRRGMKIDLNRMLGNGLDDDGDGVIDDPQELANGAIPERVNGGTIWNAVGDFTPEANSPDVNTLVDPDGGASIPNALDSRQRMAKDLYCLMMGLLYDTNLNQLYDFPERPAAVNAQDYTAWKIAQWAVNVVDFRDSDAIMTRFAYDNRPFNGWDLTNAAETRVVYGMEAPELLLTESLNWHDRRVKETPTGGDAHSAGSNWGDAGLDNDLDQTRMPQGTTFLELYCPRSPISGRAPAGITDQNTTGFSPPNELYDVLNNRAALNLAAEAPDGNPVFRVAISEIHVGGQTAAGNESPQERLNPANIDLLRTAMFQTSQTGGSLPPAQRLHMDAFNNADNITVDRIIWMSNRNPATVAAANRPADTNERNVYWNRYTVADYTGAGLEPGPYLRGGQYAVIGPREQSFLGARTTPGTADQFDYQSKQRIQLLPNQVRTFDFDGTVNDPNEPTVNPRSVVDAPDRDGPNGPERIRPVVGILAAANPPAGWGNATIPNIGVSISEPVPGGSYYPEPDTETYPGLDDSYPTPLDTPLDKAAARPLGNALNVNGQRTGTREDFRTALLQRLADPTRNYNADTNPYITVDWIPMDLTVFNGEEPETIRQDMAGISRHIDGDDPNPYDDMAVSGGMGTGDMGLPIRLGSRYKSGVAVGAGNLGANPRNLIYSLDTLHLRVAPAGPNTSTVNGAAPVNFRHELNVDVDANAAGAVVNRHSTTLGYLNHSFGTRWEALNPNDLTMADWLGVPNQAAFPWVPWFNREFSSPYELMFVPTSAPGRLGAEFFLPNNSPNANVGNPFDGTDPITLAGHYGSFWNFLAYDEDTDGTGGDTRQSPNFHRLLEWVRTPQPFDNLEQMVRPSALPATPVPSVWPIPFTTPRQYVNRYASELFRPPFNWISPPDRRGKINLNTIIDQNVYRSLMLPRSRVPGEFQSGAFWNEFVASRRRYVPTAEDLDPTSTNPNLVLGLNPDFPTPFVGAFQPATSAHIAPPLHANGAPANRLRLPESAVTLNRESNTAGQPLFERPAATAVPANTPNRHPFFRHDEVSRLANLTTDNSNTFAMWVTVGLFEVNPATLDVLGEYGADQGVNKRFRAYYIIDRSVPVAYEPGREHNARNTIIYSRILN